MTKVIARVLAAHRRYTSGNGDALLGLVLMLVAISVLVAAAATAGHWWSPVVSITAVWLLFTAIMLRASWPLPGRPAPAAAMRAAAVAAVACALLAWAAHAYFTRTSVLHAEIYQTAGTLIGVLVWCSLTCRVLLRATAMLARTDADCLPAPDWVASAKAALGGAEMACGRSVPRWDEQPSLAERRLLPAVTRLAGLCGTYRPVHRHRRYLTPYVLCHGHNIAITADLYLRCGGTPRVAPGGPAEDLGLLNRAREHSRLIVRAEYMVVGHSLRRLRAWGPRRTLLWYWDRRYAPDGPAAMDVR